MNVLFLDQFGDLGGAQRCLLEVAEAALANGWTVRLAAPGGPLRERMRALGAHVEEIRCGPFHAGRKTARDTALFVAQTAPLALRIARLAAGADLVYVNGPRLLPAAALATRGSKPFLFHCHSRVPAGISERLARRSLRMARARVVAACRYVGEPWSDFTVVYNGVPGPASVAPPHQEVRVGVVGRIAPEKGQAQFLEAAREIPGCRFTVCGAPLFGDADAMAYAVRLRELAAGMPVEFTGWSDDVYRVLAALDLLAVPSAQEATTRVILEAYAAGVPVVAFRAGGIPEVVEHGRTGLLVEPGDVPGLARAMAELLQSPERMRAMGRAGRSLWSKRFTLERFQREMLREMEVAASGKEAPRARPGPPRPPARRDSRSA